MKENFKIILNFEKFIFFFVFVFGSEEKFSYEFSLKKNMKFTFKNVKYISNEK